MLGLRSLRAHSHVAVFNARSTRLLTSRIPASCRRQSTIRQPTEREVKKEAEREQREEVLKNERRRVPFWIAMGLVMYIGFSAARLAVAVIKTDDDDSVKDISQQKDVAAVYDDIANSFDSDVYIPEWFMGLLKIRMRIAKLSEGNVLEVSCGTGRNLGYYELDNEIRKIKSLTLIDLSPQMIEVCKKKFMALRRNKVREDKTKENTTPKSNTIVRFAAVSALDEMPLAPDGNKYDTIVQTMGVCSTPAPVELIVNMARHLELHNPNARIWLLEHGRSKYDWLNRIIDSSASKHAERFGCWYNRDVDAIVAEAAEKTGFELVKAQRKHLGTTFVYELKPGPHAAEKVGALKLEPVAQRPAQPATSTWTKWFSWGT